MDEFAGFLRSTELSPWNLTETDTLSRGGKAETSEGLWSTTEKGVIHSIYEEPIVAYAVRTYRSTNKKSVAIRLNEDIYDFDLQGRNIFVNSDGHGSMGKITMENGITFTSSSCKVSIDLHNPSPWMPGFVNERKTFAVRRYEEHGDEYARVMEMVEDLSEEESKAVALLVCFGIVDEQI